MRSNDVTKSVGRSIEPTRIHRRRFRVPVPKTLAQNFSGRTTEKGFNRYRGSESRTTDRLLKQMMMPPARRKFPQNVAEISMIDLIGEKDEDQEEEMFPVADTDL